jgi:hypothetical protein
VTYTPAERYGKISTTRGIDDIRIKREEVLKRDTSSEQDEKHYASGKNKKIDIAGVSLFL